MLLVRERVYCLMMRYASSEPIVVYMSPYDKQAPGVQAELRSPTRSQHIFMAGLS